MNKNKSTKSEAIKSTHWQKTKSESS